MDINQYMIDNKYDNKKLAAKLKVSENYVYMLRTGKRKISQAIEDKLNDRVGLKVGKDSVVYEILKRKDKYFIMILELLVKHEYDTEDLYNALNEYFTS